MLGQDAATKTRVELLNREAENFELLKDEDKALDNCQAILQLDATCLRV